MERNEVDAKAMGGTELLGLGLERHVHSELLSKFQIIRSRVRQIDPNRIPILWLHDLPWDPESKPLSDPKFRAQFKKIVFVSHWQQQMYNFVLGVPYEEGIVIPNAIELFGADFTDPLFERTNQLLLGGKTREPRIIPTIIYHSTPHRGLEVAYNALASLHWRRPDLPFRFKVFSSFGLYGWPQRDEQFKQLFADIAAHPSMTYSKNVPNEQIRSELVSSDLFFYPSTWLETSCLCAIEALAAGCDILTTNYGALCETVGGVFPEKLMSSPLRAGVEIEGWLDRWHNEPVDFAIQRLEELDIQSRVFNEDRSWEKISEKYWIPLLESLR